MLLNNNWRFEPHLNNLFNVVEEKIFLRFDYFNNGISCAENCIYYDNLTNLQLNKKFSSKNISDYYKGFSLIANGIYEGHLVDPSSLHIWDSRYETSSEVQAIRNYIICCIDGVENNNKICLPIKYQNIICEYVEVGEKPIPNQNDVISYNPNNFSLNKQIYCEYSFPKITLNLNSLPWHFKHFPIYVNNNNYNNILDCDFAKLIYFYYQRQNPYIQKAYVLSNTNNIFCDFYLEPNEKEKNIKNKFGAFFYGFGDNFNCSSYLNNAEFSAAFTGDSNLIYPTVSSLITSQCYYEDNYFFSETKNININLTNIDKNNNIYDFQQCACVISNKMNINFLVCKNNFLIKDTENPELCSDIWYTTGISHNGLPNLNMKDFSNPFCAILSSDYLSEVNCVNVII